MCVIACVCLFCHYVYFLLSAIGHVKGSFGYKREGTSVIFPHLVLLFGAIIMSGQDRKKPVTWLSKDVRETGTKPRVQPKPKVKKGKEVCSLCGGICCGTARELIVEAFGMGKIQVSPKVIKDLLLLVVLFKVFQGFR